MKTLIAGAAFLAGSSVMSFGQADVIDIFFGAPTAPGSFILRTSAGVNLEDGDATVAFGFIDNSAISGDLSSLTFENFVSDFNIIASDTEAFVGNLGLASAIETIETTLPDGETNLPFIDSTDVTFFFLAFIGADLATASEVFAATDSSFGTIPAGVDVPVIDAPDVDLLVTAFDTVILGEAFDGEGFGGSGVAYNLVTTVIPEPGTYAAIFGISAFCLAALRRHSKRRA